MELESLDRDYLRQPSRQRHQPIYGGAISQEERYLAESTESVLGQTFQHREHLIVGSCGTDASFDIAQQLCEEFTDWASAATRSTPGSSAIT